MNTSWPPAQKLTAAMHYPFQVGESRDLCVGWPFARRNIHPVLLDVEQHLPVKALFPVAGFWREHQVQQT